jgi:Carboxypeptidase regulatory-like domain/TonB dependent receptor
MSGEINHLFVHIQAGRSRMITNAHTRLALILATFIISAVAAFSQTESATVSGRVTDTSGSIVPGTEVELRSTDRGTSQQTVSNPAGIYSFPSVQPGQYHMAIRKAGFRQIEFVGLVVNVQDHIEKNFQLQVGSVSETVTVTGGAPLVNTEDASVSTVVDRNFAENLPMNGRSFQTLIELTPGVVLVPSNGNDGGQFSVNGQRAASNYWTLDGVSANIGVPAVFTQGNGIAGAAPSFSIQGGTNSLVSVDAMQEFRIQTSTYAPEFGRTPGAQVSIVTRPGTNEFHGNLFDYLRNDILDSNDWFAHRDELPKPKERQNDFGGTFGGPLHKDRTFFFFSYEGLRLRLPQVVESNVPDVAARQNANSSVQPFLNAFPLPTPGAPDNTNTGVAQFNSTFSNSSSLDAYSIRIDHKPNQQVSIFGRYNYSPSTLDQRGFFGALSLLAPSRLTTQTATLGATWLITATAADEFRFNYSRTNGHSHSESDNFGGAVPLTSPPLPSPFTDRESEFIYNIDSLNSALDIGLIGKNIQRQINVTDNLSLQKGTHSLKFGVDWRRLAPTFQFPDYVQQVIFGDVPSAQSGSLLFSVISSDRPGALLLHNLGIFAEDTWRASPRLTLTYGVRWDLDFAPSSSNGVGLPAVSGFNLKNLSSLALAPVGTPTFHTTYGNFAPRVGAAYQISTSQRWQTVLRGGFGLFYDLATSEIGNTLHEGVYPFGAISFSFGGSFPLDPASAEPPQISATQLASGLLFAFDPHVELPYTLQWSGALEQGLGVGQSLSASYIGSRGRRLMQSAFVSLPNANIGSAQLTTNAATSDYDALQFQFQRRLSHGLQTLASYTWSHSIDTASAGSVFGNQANALVPGTGVNSNRGSSDFDVRNAFSAGMTYTIPAPRQGGVTKVLLDGWSVQNVIQARSAPPEDLFDSALFFQGEGSFTANVRPDVVSGSSFYLFGKQYPGGKALNPAAFVPPPTDPNSGAPLRQGTLPRNAVRAFAAAQWDLAVHREFPIHESLNLQFRAEMFNILNHPDFGPPVPDLANSTQFGRSIQMLNRSLDNGNQGGGSFSPLYQIGGPRSIQLGLKLQF